MLKTRIAAAIASLFPGIQGALPVIPDNGAMPDQIGLINAILAQNPWPATAFNSASNTTAFTMTPQQTMSAEFTVLSLPSLAGATAVTLPTVANLIAALTTQQNVVGSSVTLRVMNPSASTATMTTNTGWTLNGVMTIPTLSFRDFFVTLSNVGTTPTAVFQSVGGGAAAAQ